MSNWIITYSGKKIYFNDGMMEQNQYDIVDIAHSLSQQCRFTGHTRKFYSVAEHSVRISDLCSPENALWGLLHDAAEAYIGDLNKPFKLMLPSFSVMEEKLMEGIKKQFGLIGKIPKEVKWWDLEMGRVELRDLMDFEEEKLETDIFMIGTWESKRAYQEFIMRFIELTK